MSQICQTLENWKFELIVVKRDGLELVEAKRSDNTMVSNKAAARSLLELTRKQEEALAWLRARQPAPPQYLTKRLYEIEQTDWAAMTTEQEAALIYEYCAVAADAGLGPKRTSDGRDWKELLNTL